MDKRQSDHIENRFRQAADNFLPLPNEEAWKRMEALLDKDADRRRPFIWWWMFALLLVGAGSVGTYYYLSNRPKENRSTVQLKNNKALPGAHFNNKANMPRPVVTDLSKRPTDSAHNKEALQKHTNELVLITDTQTTHKTFLIDRKDTLIAKPGLKQKHQTGAYTNSSNRYTGKDYAIERNKRDKAETMVLQNRVEDTDPAVTRVSSSYQQPAYGIEVYIPDSVLQHPDSRLVLQDSLQTAINNAIKKAAQQGPKPAKLYFIAAAGGNATNLRKFDTANVGFVFGGDIGYHLNSMFSIQAGFHAGRKIYIAGPADYNPKLGSYWRNSMITIKKVDANCYIFELPLSVRADLLHNRSRALFATAGLSSFITNKEVYGYHYNYGPAYNFKKVTYKGNVDWFTSARFSVGFEQKLFSKFYLQAEPYAILPLSGIGEGRVKLYSLGLQLGLKYQPLKRK